MTLVSLVIGGIGGFLSGLLGIGGGVVLVPLMVQFGGIPIKEAANISMWFLVVSCVSGVAAHKKLGNIEWETSVWLGGGSVAGSVASSLFAANVSEKALQAVFVGVVCLSIVMLLAPLGGRRNESERLRGTGRAKTAALGFFQGLITGALGVGGGFLVVPLMIGLLGMPTLKAVGTSLTVLFFSAIAALLSRLAVSDFIWPDAAAGILVGALLCPPLGSRIASRVDPRYLRWALLVLLIIIAVKMTAKLVFPVV